MSTFGYTVAGFGAGPDEVAPQEVTVDAVDFNGTTSQIRYANSIFRDVNFKFGDSLPQEMTISFWCKLNTIGNNTTCHVWNVDDVDNSSSPTQAITTSNSFTADGSGNISWRFFYSTNKTNPNSFFIGFQTGSGHINLGSWQHFIICVQYDSSGKTVLSRIDGADVLSGITVTNQDMNSSGFDTADTFIGVDKSYGLLGAPNEFGDTFSDMCLTQFFIQDKFYDINQTTNLRKFYSVNGKPVQTPANPLVLLQGSASTWTNSGSSSLGTQTLSNITDCADSPSD